MKPRLTVIGPLPPPFHGVTVSTSLILKNDHLKESFSVEHFDTSDHRTRETVGKWELLNIWLALKHAGTLLKRLSRPRGIVYLPISGGLPGFIRDSLLIYVARLRGWRVIGHFRNGDFHLFLRKQPRPIRWWIQTALDRMESAAVLGESIKSDYAEFLPIAHMEVIPNGTPDDVGYDKVDRNSKVPRVLYLSNLRRRKGVVEAVRAAVLCLDKGVEARFTFAGDYEDDSLARELAEIATPRAAHIEILPSVSGDAKHELYRSADIFVFPPVEPEGHPRVVLEAMAAGLPVICTARGAIPETIVNGEGGIVHKSPTPELLAKSIQKLVEDKGLRDRMGAAARSRFVEMYTEERADERMAQWLLRLAEGPAR